MTGMDFEAIIKKDFYSEEANTIVLSDDEVLALCELDTLCYEPGLEYDEENVRMFLAEKGSLLIRIFKDNVMIGFQLSNIKKRELITLDVHPDYRRLGLGKKILKLTLEEFVSHKCKKVHCQISVRNIPSVMLHLKFGFKPLFIIPFYYPDGTAAYWFEKKLS